MLGLVNTLGYDKCFLVGHDWGGWLMWQLALLHSDVFVAVCAMSVPYAGRDKVGLLTMLKKRFGDPTENAPGGEAERREAQFFYMLHHNLPEAPALYDANAREALYRIYGFLPGVECEDGTPEVTDKRMYVPTSESSDSASLGETPTPGFWQRIPRPVQLPAWLPADDFEYYVSEFQRSGFAGGLNWYRTPDINHSITPLSSSLSGFFIYFLWWAGAHVQNRSEVGSLVWVWCILLGSLFSLNIPLAHRLLT